MTRSSPGTAGPPGAGDGPGWTPELFAARYRAARERATPPYTDQSIAAHLEMLDGETGTEPDYLRKLVKRFGLPADAGRTKTGRNPGVSSRRRPNRRPNKRPVSLPLSSAGSCATLPGVMPTFYIALPDDAADRLRELARRERRSPRQQAAVLVLAALEREAARPDGRRSATTRPRRARPPSARSASRDPAPGHLDRRPRRPGPRGDHPAPAHPLRPAADRPPLRLARDAAALRGLPGRRGGGAAREATVAARPPPSRHRRRTTPAMTDDIITISAGAPPTDLTPGVYEVTLIDISEPRTIYPQTGVERRQGGPAPRLDVRPRGRHRGHGLGARPRRARSPRPTPG